VSIHNPSDTEKTYSITLNRAFGLLPGSGTFNLSSPIADCTAGLKAEYAYGDSLKLTLKPREIRILNFDKTARDWSKLRALQTRTEADGSGIPAPAKPRKETKPVSLKGHAILGTWHYKAGKADYSRAFTAEGECILRMGGDEVWTKPVTRAGKNHAVVSGRYRHEIQPDGTLRIEGRYTARKR
jgi:hypothetical protein